MRVWIVFAVAASIYGQEQSGVWKPVLKFHKWIDQYNIMVNVPYYLSTLTLVCVSPSIEDDLLSGCDGSDNLELVVKGEPVKKWLCDEPGKWFYYDLVINESTIFGDYQCHYRGHFSDFKMPLNFRFCGPHETSCTAVTSACSSADYCLVNETGPLPCSTTTIDTANCVKGDGRFCPVENNQTWDSHCKGVVTKTMADFHYKTPSGGACSARPFLSKGPVTKIAAEGRDWRSKSTVPFDHYILINQTQTFYVECRNRNYESVTCRMYGSKFAHQTDAFEQDKAQNQTFFSFPKKNCTWRTPIEYTIPPAVFEAGIQVNRLVCLLQETPQTPALTLQAFLVIFGQATLVIKNKEKHLECQLNPPGPPELQMWCTWTTGIRTIIAPANATAESTTGVSTGSTMLVSKEKNPTMDSTKFFVIIPNEQYRCSCKLAYHACQPFETFSDSRELISEVFQIRRPTTTSSSPTTTSTKDPLVKEIAVTANATQSASRTATGIPWFGLSLGVVLLQQQKGMSMTAGLFLFILIHYGKPTTCYNCTNFTTCRTGRCTGKLCTRLTGTENAQRQITQKTSTDNQLKLGCRTIMVRTKQCDFCVCKEDFCDRTRGAKRPSIPTTTTTESPSAPDSVSVSSKRATAITSANVVSESALITVHSRGFRYFAKQQMIYFGLVIWCAHALK